MRAILLLLLVAFPAFGQVRVREYSVPQPPIVIPQPPRTFQEITETRVYETTPRLRAFPVADAPVYVRTYDAPVYTVPVYTAPAYAVPVYAAPAGMTVHYGLFGRVRAVTYR